MKILLRTSFASLFFACICLTESKPQYGSYQGGQILWEDKKDIVTTYPDGTRKEEIIDDEFVRRPGGSIVEIKTDEVITGGNRYPGASTGFGNQSSRYPSQQGFSSSYPSQQQGFSSGYPSQQGFSSSYPSQQQGFSTGYPSQDFSSGYRTQGLSQRYSNQGTYSYGK